MSKSSSCHSFIHPLAEVQSRAVGKDTRIWQFSVILEKARIGSQCNICSHVFIENDVVIGDRVTVKCGVQLWDGIIIENDVFIGPNATFVNDLHPRSRPATWIQSRTLIRRGVSIGANATVLPVTVGCWAIVGAGTVVTRDVPDHALIIGSPGRQVGWVCLCGQKLDFQPDHTSRCSCGKAYQLTRNHQTIELLP